MWRAVEVGHLLDAGLPEGRGLDLGCGDGLLTRIILESAGRREMVGVDPDPGEVSQAARLALYTSVHAARGDSVPEADRSFDWVLSNSVLEHIPDLDPVLDEVARLLRPGGRFIFTVPGPHFHACLRGSLTGGSRARYLEDLDRRLAHFRYWGPAEWETALAPHGLHVLRTSEYLTQTEVRRWESMSRMTAGVLYRLARGRRRPIEIQRTLGMRRAGAQMPRALAESMAAFVSIGLDGDRPPARFGCLLVIAVKHATAPTSAAGTTG